MCPIVLYLCGIYLNALPCSYARKGIGLGSLGFYKGRVVDVVLVKNKKTTKLKKREKSCFFCGEDGVDLWRLGFWVEWHHLKRAIIDFKTILNQEIDLDHTFDEIIKI